MRTDFTGRLVDVFPDGTATRISYGLLNLTHRDGHAEPRELEPGKVYCVQVKLNDVAQIPYTRITEALDLTP